MLELYNSELIWNMVLQQLLDTGIITRDQVEKAVEQINARSPNLSEWV